MLEVLPLLHHLRAERVEQKREETDRAGVAQQNRVDESVHGRTTLANALCERTMSCRIRSQPDQSSSSFFPTNETVPVLPVYDLPSRESVTRLVKSIPRLSCVRSSKVVP